MVFSMRSIIVSVCLLVSASAVPSHRRLHSDLLAGYNKQVRPVINESDSVHLQFGMALIDFSLDQQSDILETLAWLRFKWTDQYLRWESSEYDGIKTSMFNPNSIWTPDICLYNSWEKQCEPPASSNTIISSDGGVLWVPPARLSSRCELDRRNWPRDEASCLFKFGSWTHNGFMVNMSMYGNVNEMDASDLRDNREWQVTNHSAKLNVKYYSCCPEPYHSIEYVLKLRRNEHTTAECSLPIICAVVLMLLAFLVPVTSTHKLTFCWVSLLFALLGMFNMFSKLPKDAHGVASIATFYVTFTALLLVFTTVEVLVTCLSRPRTTPLPRCLRGCLSGLMGKLLCLETPIFHDYSPDAEMLDSSQDGSDGVNVGFQKSHHEGGKSYEWAILAGAVDRVTGLVFLLLVAVIVPPNLTWE